MKIIIQKGALPLHAAIQRAGYHAWRDPNTGKQSYAKRLGRDGHFPKFHLYVTERAEDAVFDLHIDQKQVSYAGSRMHSGEYEGHQVQQELARLKESILKRYHDAQAEQSSTQKKSFFGKLFG